MPTASDVIAIAQATYEDMTAAQGLAMLQQIYDDLAFDFPLDKTTVSFTSIVAGTQNYALGQQYTSVRSVTWFRSSGDNDFVALEPLDADQLDVEQPGWRYMSRSEPYGFLLDAGEIVFFPNPDRSTSGGYPYAKAEAYKTQTLVSGTTLPTSVYGTSVYENGIRMKWAERRDKANYEMWRSLYEDDIRRLERYFGKRNRRFRRQQYVESYSVGWE